MAYQKVKLVKNYTFEESEFYFREDCKTLLTTEQFNAARKAGNAMAELADTDAKKWSAYNLQLSKALSLHAGIDSWRDWRMQDLGQNTKPAKKFIPPKSEKLNSDQMKDLISPNSSKRKGGKTIAGFIRGDY